MKEEEPLGRKRSGRRHWCKNYEQVQNIDSTKNSRYL